MQRNEQGFTLLEVVVAVAISSVISYALFLALRMGDEQIRTTDLKMTIQDSMREGLYKMIQEIRQSAPGKVNIDSSGNSISFSIPDPNNAVGDDYSANWDDAIQVSYALGGDDGNQIMRTVSNDVTTKVMANDVTGVTFAGNAGNPTLVTLTMNVQRTLTNGRLVPSTPLQMTGQAEVRNVSNVDDCTDDDNDNVCDENET